MTEREDFLNARAGSLGASDVPDIIRVGRNGAPSATRKNKMGEKIAELLSGRPTRSYVSRAMLDGIEREARGRATFSWNMQLEIITVPPPGIIPHPTIIGAHASPDGLIGDDGLYEGKAPEHAQHIAMLDTKKIDPDYHTQIMWQMACTRRSWCWFASFNPDFDPEFQLWSCLVHRDPARIVELETAVRKFVAEARDTVERLKREYGR